MKHCHIKRFFCFDSWVSKNISSFHSKNKKAKFLLKYWCVQKKHASETHSNLYSFSWRASINSPTVPQTYFKKRLQHSLELVDHNGSSQSPRRFYAWLLLYAYSYLLSAQRSEKNWLFIEPQLCLRTKFLMTSSFFQQLRNLDRADLQC